MFNTEILKNVKYTEYCEILKTETLSHTECWFDTEYSDILDTDMED